MYIYRGKYVLLVIHLLLNNDYNVGIGQGLLVKDATSVVVLYPTNYFYFCNVLCFDLTNHTFLDFKDICKLIIPPK